MKSQIKKLSQSQIEIEIEISAEDLNKFIEQAAFKLSQNLKVEGFRQGKAPKEIVEQKIGKENILVEAADLAIKENYKKVILENKFEPIEHPEIDILKVPAAGSPFVFRVKTTVLPEIKLPDYKKIASAVRKRKVLIEENEVEETLKWFQKSRAKFTLKNEPAKIGDFVEIEYWASEIEGLDPLQSQKDTFILGESQLLPGFEEALVGMKTNEEKKDVILSWPENHHINNLAGRKAKFKIKMKSVQKVELPEINDQFAQGIGNFKDLNNLRTSIKEGIIFEKEAVESQRIRAEILAKINEAVKCETPQVLVENEKKRIFGEFKKNIENNLKISFADYLTKLKKSEKEISDSFSVQAQKKVKNYLILRAIAKIEKIEATEKELTDEINNILKNYENAEQVKKAVDPDQVKVYTKEAIQNEKVFQMLEAEGAEFEPKSDLEARK